MKKNVISIIIAAFLLLTSFKNSDNYTNVDNLTDNIYLKWTYNIYGNGYITPDNAHRYVDFETLESTVLCAKPNCTHKDSECVANIIEDTPIMFNGYLYYFVKNSGINETEDGREFYIDTRLNRVSMDSSEIEEITAFTDCTPREEEGCFLSGNMLYFCGFDWNPTADEYGNIITRSAGGMNYLCSVNLETGKYKNYGSIYDGDKQYEAASSSSSAKIREYYDSKIYIEYSFMKESLTLDEMHELDARDYFTVLTFEFDPETETLTESDLPSASYMDSDSYVYSNYPENSSTIIDEGKTYTIEGLDVDLIGRLFNGKLFMYEEWYDITDGSKHSLGEYATWEVLTMYDDCYILRDGNNFVKLTEEELLAL
ncbi:MAG: hypothetical protein LUD57_01190 [Ruminococcus sp.]|nr:hypothetical protein [Ruminococcus sp.]